MTTLHSNPCIELTGFFFVGVGTFPTNGGRINQQFGTDEEKTRQLNEWITVQRGHAVANGLHVLSCNRTGHEADPSGVTNGIQFWGNSFVAGPQGEFLVQASNDKEENIIIDIDLQRSENVRRWWPFFRDRRIDAFGDITKRWRDE
jgi:N-carbamoylputrescine amidase